MKPVPRLWVSGALAAAALSASPIAYAAIPTPFVSEAVSDQTPPHASDTRLPSDQATSQPNTTRYRPAHFGSSGEGRLHGSQDRILLSCVTLLLAVCLGLSIFGAFRSLNRSRLALRAANEKLLLVSRHDPLTGLIGRAHFNDRFEHMLAEIHAGDRPPASLMLIDLDYFKKVNDVYGHRAGDEILVQAAERFRDVLGPDCEIGRVGGDEFAALVPYLQKATAARDLAQRLVGRIKEPFMFAGETIRIGASVGIAVLGKDGDTSSTVTTNADLALYEAKRRGRGTSVIYRPAMRSAVEERASLEKGLTQALQNGELKLHFQPIVEAGGGDIVCREALMRWDHPERGLLYPDLFIPLAEDRHIIQQLGAWLLRSACVEAAAWDDDIRLALNISTVQLDDANFLKFVVEALASSSLPADRLILELDESIFSKMDAQLVNTLQSLRVLGVHLALDHFGRGHSSLSYLEMIDFSMIKIDRGFVQSAAAGSAGAVAIVSAIISLAQTLGFDITAEGVEGAEQAETMKSFGCTHLQGYLFGRPEELITPDVAPMQQSSRAG